MWMRSIRQHLNISEECFGQNEVRRADGLAASAAASAAAAAAQLRVRVRQRLEHVVVNDEAASWAQVWPQRHQQRERIIARGEDDGVDLLREEVISSGIDDDGK